MKIFIRKTNLIKKSIRRLFKRSKFNVIENNNIKSNTIFEKSLNIIFIKVVAFQFLTNIKNKIKIKTFSLIIKQLNEINDKTKKNLNKVEFNSNFNFKIFSLL